MRCTSMASQPTSWTSDVRVQVSGHSLIVRITPAARHLGIEEGDIVRMRIDVDEEIIPSSTYSR